MWHFSMVFICVVGWISCCAQLIERIYDENSVMSLKIMNPRIFNAGSNTFERSKGSVFDRSEGVDGPYPVCEDSKEIKSIKAHRCPIIILISPFQLLFMLKDARSLMHSENDLVQISLK